MKILKLASCITLTALLAACGGSGGSGTAETPDGTKINLKDSPKGFVEAKTDKGTLKGVNMDDSFYGAWLDDNKVFKELRYQGTQATDIPKSGSATYKGEAVYVSGYDGNIKKGGQTILNVDFGQKTVDGKITFSVANGDEFRRDITLHKGSLSGAKFNGQASVLGNSGGRYEGGLFGKGASEAAGLVKFSNNSDLDVSFGGKKQ